MEPVIKTSQLSKYYGKAPGIVDLDLEVHPGDFFGFIGPNGAGKSTTIRTLLGLITPTSGSAQIFGKDIAKEKETILREIGYLPSEVRFYPGMKVKDVLKLSADLRKKDCHKEAIRLCQRLQLDPSLKVDELSFGNRKKVAIVCALQHCPKLLILDEPTSGLDPLMQKEFFAILRERNEQGATILLSSHILSEIEQHCTKAAIIRKGQIIACDRVNRLTRTNARQVKAFGSIDVSRLEEVRNLQQTPDSISFLYGGKLQPLLQVLLESEVRDFTLTEPDLEDVFLHYYEQKKEVNDGSVSA